MSVEALNDFFKGLDSNEDMSKEFDGLSQDNYKDNVVALAKKYGYEFTVDELDQVIEAAKLLKEKLALQQK